MSSWGIASRIALRREVVNWLPCQGDLVMPPTALIELYSRKLFLYMSLAPIRCTRHDV